MSNLIGTTRIEDPNGGTVYLDESGRVVYPPELEGLTRCVDDDGVVYVDENGKVQAEG